MPVKCTIPFINAIAKHVHTTEMSKERNRKTQKLWCLAQHKLSECVFPPWTYTKKMQFGWQLWPISQAAGKAKKEIEKWIFPGAEPFDICVDTMRWVNGHANAKWGINVPFHCRGIARCGHLHRQIAAWCGVVQQNVCVTMIDFVQKEMR